VINARFFTFHFCLRMLEPIYESFLTVLYPQPCHNCNNSVESGAEGIACRDCWSKARLFTGKETLCKKCGAFLRESGGSVEASCGKCGDHHYDSARAVGIYEHALAASVINLKKAPYVCTKLASLFLTALESREDADHSLIIPVPLSKKRRLERGFNQAEVLAAILAKPTGKRVVSDNLIRTVHTPIHRAAMDRKAREMSVRNAFELKHPKLIRGEKVLLVDDVFTSGATASNCARVLKKHGASEVRVITLARAA
jgi:competence protein ComFC